jgi:hypothetical protein
VRVVESEWEVFKHAVGLAEATPLQLREIRRAFYAGATSLFFGILSSLDAGDEPTDKEMERMRAIGRELCEFNERVKRGEA